MILFLKIQLYLSCYLLFIVKKIRNLRSSLPIKHIPWISGIDESCLKVLLVLGLDAGPWAA